MRVPLYNVGDAVVLQSVSLPELNGNYRVRSVIRVFQDHICAITGDDVVYESDFDSSFGYLLDPPVLSPETGKEAAFEESALRRRYPPAEESFKQIMNKLTRVSM